MTLLIIYLCLAIGVSFLCSLVEAAILTVSDAQAEMLANRGRKTGAILRKMKKSIDRPLAAILTLNTISHTIGAAGVGAQSALVFGEVWVGLTSAVLTLLILVVSEIIPKTIGATYANLIIEPVVHIIRVMIWTTWPIVIALDAVSRVLKGSGEHQAMSREQLDVMAELARAGGAIDINESRMLRNLLKLREVRVEDVMTPRTVTLMLQQDETVEKVLTDHPRLRFSRIPVFGESADDVKGLILKTDLYERSVADEEQTPISELIRPIHPVPDTATLMQLMDEFARVGQHLFLVVDEYGGTAGVVTLEDAVESILGTEIVDETDPVADMRKLAARKARREQAAKAAVAQSGLPDTPPSSPTTPPSSDPSQAPPAASEDPANNTPRD